MRIQNGSMISAWQPGIGSETDCSGKAGDITTQVQVDQQSIHSIRTGVCTTYKAGCLVVARQLKYLIPDSIIGLDGEGLVQ